MSKPSILIVVENLPVPLDRRVWQEACALRDAGYEVAVVCPQMRGSVSPEETLEGIHIYRHWISEEAGGLWGFFGEYVSALWGEWWLMWKAWRRHRFKVIHLCNPPDLLFLVAWPFKWFCGVRVIYDVHDLWPEMFEAKFGKRGFLYWLVRVAERLTYACADVVLATNESVRHVALTRGRKSADRVFVVRTAPKLDGLACRPEASLKKNRRFLVGYVGVMGNADGVNYLIDAADYLINKKGRRDVQFLLMGTGPEHAHLVQQRERLGLGDYIDMPGRVSNEDLFQGLCTMDLGVACDPINSYNDHCTMNKVLEYMAVGKAQVMFDLKEGRASAAGAARYVGENSAAKLAEAIADLLDNLQLREQMGQIGRERLHRELNWERSVEHLLHAYGAVEGRKNGGIIEQKQPAPFPRESETMAPVKPPTAVPPAELSFGQELARCWQEMPYKGLFFGLFGCWFALFWFLGNPTLGYVDSPAILGWLDWVYKNSADDAHGRLMPLVVLVLFWWKRKELLEVAKRPWWPGVVLLGLALGLHVIGYTIQQPQVCLVAFLAGIYAVMGVAWGFGWLKASFFPFFLLGFCVPVANVIVALTFPLRMAATKITATLCKSVLGINVVQEGTRILDALGQYSYEVAAACSGIRSLTATTAIAMIYAFVGFTKPWQRIVIVASALPLAVVSNVFRLSSIIIAAEAFGQKAGDWVHNSTWLSLLPYVPAIGGMLVLGHLINRKWTPKNEVLAGRGLTSAATEVGS